MKQNNKVLFAIYRNSIHLGNNYGKTKRDSIVNYLFSSYRIQFQDITIKEILEIEEINDFKAIQAIERIHYFKSKYLKEDNHHMIYKKQIFKNIFLSPFMQISENREEYLAFHRQNIFKDNIDDLL